MSVNEPGGQFDGIVCIVCIVVSLVVLCKWSTKNLEAPTIMRGLGSKGMMMMMTMIMSIMSILMIMIALSLLSTIVIFTIVVAIIIIIIAVITIIITIIIIIIRRVYSISVLLMYLLLLDLILSLLRPLRDSWPTNSSNHLHQESTLEASHPIITFLIKTRSKVPSNWPSKYLSSGIVCWVKIKLWWNLLFHGQESKWG